MLRHKKLRHGRKHSRRAGKKHNRSRKALKKVRERNKRKRKHALLIKKKML